MEINHLDDNHNGQRQSPMLEMFAIFAPFAFNY
ncbi:hypothetical protein DERF_015803 [Dermatophagoides farinae]|uniref:Uncharacterized protein n=1 Tax=Dermatophagoides farinae TaxID=6954 RepID=A0A922KY51_DERFA|nr:hypothetical protein DERF_015803 [Dermatophagoides farinae]